MCRLCPNCVVTHTYGAANAQVPHRVGAHVGPMGKSNLDPIDVRRSSTKRVTRMRTAIIGGAVVTSLAAAGILGALQGAGAATTASGTASSFRRALTTRAGPPAPESALVSNGSGTTHATSKGS